MKPFEPKHKHGKIIALYFESKAEAMREMGITRPTIDKICKEGDLFYKYIPSIAMASKVLPSEIIRNLNKME